MIVALLNALVLIWTVVPALPHIALVVSGGDWMALGPLLTNGQYKLAVACAYAIELGVILRGRSLAEDDHRAMQIVHGVIAAAALGMLWQQSVDSYIGGGDLATFVDMNSYKLAVCVTSLLNSLGLLKGRPPAAGRKH